jgi:hypothetical protein
MVKANLAEISFRRSTAQLVFLNAPVARARKSYKRIRDAGQTYRLGPAGSAEFRFQRHLGPERLSKSIPGESFFSTFRIRGHPSEINQPAAKGLNSLPQMENSRRGILEPGLIPCKSWPHQLVVGMRDKLRAPDFSAKVEFFQK